MDAILAAPSLTHVSVSRRAVPGVATARAAVLLTVALGLAIGFLVTPGSEAQAAANRAGAELATLLRAMAGLKLLFAAAAIGVTLWRLGAPVTWPRLAAYAAGCAAMTAGPGLIWDMAHVAAGALLLHGGLLATVLLLWRDPATAARLAKALAARRAGQRA